MDQNNKENIAQIVEETTVEDNAESGTQSTDNTDNDAQKNKGMAIVAYFIFFLPLLTDAKNSPFVKFHVNQALNLFLLGLGVNIIATIIPVIGPLFVGPIGMLLLLVLFIMGILNAYNGQMKKLPIIGELELIK